MMMSHGRIPRAAIAFQSELDEVLAAPAPRLLCTALLLTTGLLATVIGIAACVRTDIVVIGTGTLAADAPMIVLQPMERAVVRDLRVRAGDRVHRGEVLATLDSTFTQADLDTLGRQMRDADARLWRLAAELSATPPERLAAVSDEQAMQAQLYARRQQEYRLRLDGFDQALARDAAALHAAQQATVSGAGALAVATDIATLRHDLLKMQSGSRLSFLQAEDARIQAAHALDEAHGRTAELTHALDATQAERLGFISQWHRQALDDLIAATAERARLRDQLAKAARLHELIQLTAPQDGIVLDVAARAAGSVLNPAEPFVSILPAASGMLAEISVPSSDIGNVADGDSVVVKVDAFPYQSHGTLHGVVRSIGRQSFRPEGGAAMHVVRVVLDKRELAVIPGMTVSAEVHAGSRNLLGYFLYPVTRGFAQSFREP